MKAVITPKYGAPDILEFQDVPKPIPTSNQVLVKVHAATVNRTDFAILDASHFFQRFFYGFTKPKKPISGTDFAGVVESVGEDVTTYKIGDSVFGFDDNGISSHAEYLIVDETGNIEIMPKVTDFTNATASIEGAHYAINFLNKVQLKSGNKVLVNGATGAIGSAMIQLLQEYEVVVDAVCGTKNIELIKSLGAEKVFDFEKEDFTKSKNKYDFIFDSVGKSSFGKCLRLLNPTGVYISSELGYMWQNAFYAIVTPITSKLPGLLKNKKVGFPFPVDIKKSLSTVKSLIEQNKYNPVLDRTYSFEEIKEAYKYVSSGKKIGNVVIDFDHTNLSK